ncbi:hypothetical protein HME9304_02259 [Flagellimonas maritima]|uniref:Four helix bundle protein n=1 Tax=Flagellimonas maritima TaxID=1383885 RepID=A0A2Z4LVA5_9FLAO|nr:four helix bundle protein [Allomuricauda aurantiaca]AWX45247.1 hypothetical protein HME9304_02259 [Allomuricauda aurantiaca]
MKVYAELDIWKESRKLVSTIYTTTNEFSKEETYGLTGQMRRCAISVPSNIAEGYGRRTAPDTIQFLHIARGSLYELETQLYLALDFNYISKPKFNKIIGDIVSCKRLMNGFIKYFKK